MKDARPAVISLCDRSGNMVRPWSAAGYRCICVDTAHLVRRDRRQGNITFTFGDVRTWAPPERMRPVIVFAFPPCTDVASSGARDFKRKGLPRLLDALDLFNHCLSAGQWAGTPYMVENPVGVLSTHQRPPDHTFDPADYAGYLEDPTEDAYTKKTCLWCGNGFIMPEPRPYQDAALPSRMHLMPESAGRQVQRAVTPRGFARAVFEANEPAVRERMHA